MFILAKHGTRITGLRLVSVKKCRSLLHLILIYGRDQRQGDLIRTTSFITTGTGSGIGAREKHVTTEHTRWTVAAGSSMLIILQRSLHQADAMLSKTTGKHPIHR